MILYSPKLKILKTWLPLLYLTGCDATTRDSESKSEARPGLADAPSERIAVAGLHNVYRLSPSLISGSSPDGEQGFLSLKSLGVKAIISVDGSTPDVERARKLEMRYVHLPFGYDGIPRRRVLELVKAIHNLPMPVYIHCHHGKHRGPTAAAVIRMSLDDCDVDQAFAEMNRAGTDRRYAGLFRTVAEFRKPSSEELLAVPNDFPEITRASNLTQVMVDIDHRWEKIQAVRAGGWKSSSEFTAAEEVVLLSEQFQELTRACAEKYPREFQEWAKQADQASRMLEHSVSGGKGAIDAVAAETAYRQTEAACSRCHTAYRDNANLHYPK